MKKLYDKNELTFSLVWIGIYIVVLSLADGLSEQLGCKKIVTAPVCIAMTAFLWFWLGRYGLKEKYGLCPLNGSARDYLYFLPLALLASVNLWWGVSMQLSVLETVLYVISMLCVGFLEEVIFRGFLFKAICRDGVKQAIIISGVTFGIGHIVNLLNGAELLPTLLQICYAIAAGFLFTWIFYTGKSLWPCIITHSALNSLSAFAPEPTSVSMRMVSAAFLCAVSVLYVVYIMKKFLTMEEK